MPLAILMSPRWGFSISPFGKFTDKSNEKMKNENIAKKSDVLKTSYFWPMALIGSSNFFELAVAVAISLFGLDSGAALATVVGVLVEVPVMLFIVYLVNGTRRWFVWEKTHV